MSISALLDPDSDAVFAFFFLLVAGVHDDDNDDELDEVLSAGVAVAIAVAFGVQNTASAGDEVALDDWDILTHAGHFDFTSLHKTDN